MAVIEDRRKYDSLSCDVKARLRYKMPMVKKKPKSARIDPAIVHADREPYRYRIEGDQLMPEDLNRQRMIKGLSLDR